MGDADITRDQFDATKRKTRIVAQRNHYIVDADFNEVGQVGAYQRAELAFLLGQNKKLRFDTGWHMTGGSNQVTISSGKALIDIGGISHVLYSSGAIIVSGFTTPSGNTRNDLIYLDITFPIFDVGGDPLIVNPAVGKEACVYEKIAFTTVKIEGTLGGGVPALPTAPAGHIYVEIASVARASGVATISDTNISNQLAPWFPLGEIVFFNQALTAAYGLSNAAVAWGTDSETSWGTPSPDSADTWYQKIRVPVYKTTAFNRIKLRCRVRSRNAGYTGTYGFTVSGFTRVTDTIATQTWTYRELTLDVSSAAINADLHTAIELLSEDAAQSVQIQQVMLVGTLE